MDLPPLTSFGQEVLTMLPLTLPIWVAGIWFFFFPDRGRRRQHFDVFYCRGIKTPFPELWPKLKQWH